MFPLKRVESVSLGSSKRDHTVCVEVLGQQIELSRRGTDGDIDRAEQTIRTLDGTIDAIGLGGIDVYLYVRGERYTVRDGLRLMQAAKRTPVVDGSGIKDTLERAVVDHLMHARGLLTPQTKVLMVSASDRFGMAEAFVEAGCDVVFGDLIFSAGMPYPITDLEELAEIARRTLPEFAKLPFNMLYPTGAAQDEHGQVPEKFAQYYRVADVIAGDWHYIRKYMPDRLDGKMILTNTTTKRDVDELRRRGVRWLATTTPAMQGRSFGTNVIEAMVVALSGERPEALGRAGYEQWIQRLALQPQLRDLGEEAG